MQCSARIHLSEQATHLVMTMCSATAARLVLAASKGLHSCYECIFRACEHAFPSCPLIPPFFLFPVILDSTSFELLPISLGSLSLFLRRMLCRFGDKNSFGKKTKFGPGIEIGDYAIVGPKSSIKDGTVVGDHNEFGSKVGGR